MYFGIKCVICICRTEGPSIAYIDVVNILVKLSYVLLLVSGYVSITDVKKHCFIYLLVYGNWYMLSCIIVRSIYLMTHLKFPGIS